LAVGKEVRIGGILDVEEATSLDVIERRWTIVLPLGGRERR
jgi:hypothetical protein